MLRSKTNYAARNCYKILLLMFLVWFIFGDGSLKIFLLVLAEGERIFLKATIAIMFVLNNEFV